MGILATDGAPLVWGSERYAAALQYVRDHGIQQLLNLFAEYKQLDNYPFFWGEEIEHIVVATDPKTGAVVLSLRAAEILDTLNRDEKATETAGWHPEYASYMVESVPGSPYDMTLQSLLGVEGNMRKRVALIDSVCHPGEFGLMSVTFPLLGVGLFHSEPSKTDASYSQSLFIPDICINQTHPRFQTLTRNIRLRRGRKVCIQIPMFLDKYTLQRTVDPVYNIDFTPQNKGIHCEAYSDVGAKRQRPVQFDDGSDDDEQTQHTDGSPSRKKPKQDVDGAAGAGATTTRMESAPESDEAKALQKRSAGAATPLSAEASEYFRHVYTPSSHYYYAQYGVHDPEHTESVRQRYNACPCPVPNVAHPCIYMDCMAFGMGLCCLQVTMQLKNVEEARHVYDLVVPLTPLMLALTSATPFQKGVLCDSDVRWVTISASVDDRRPDEVPRIMKSRYDSVSLYLSPRPQDLDSFNTNHVEIEPKYFKQLVDGGIDNRLAKHFAHYFIRDPLVIYSEGVEQLDDHKRSDHFENIQTTNWQTVRFKPPPFHSSIGWRVEFRSMEIQPTPFENAAFSVFIVLFVNASLHFHTTYYLPIHLVDTNMGIAHHRNPVSYRYHFNVNAGATLPNLTEKETVVHELTMDEIFNGVSHLPLLPGRPAVQSFEGLIPFVRRYIAEVKLTDPKLDHYLQFLSRRAKGELQTPAQLFRSFVTHHVDYQHDSRITQSICRDYVHFNRHLCRTQSWPGYLPSELTGGTFEPFVA